MPNLVVSAVAKWNGTALKKGERQLNSFQKSTNMLAKAFAAAFAVQKIAAFGKAAVKAFADDEKAAKSLAITLKNTGNGFATIATEGFISRMQKTYGVLDDELRPAFQTLLTTTGSLTTSQEALELALNISAGTGKDLASVTAALSKGYAGNTTALSRLGAGLDKALLATGDMDKITAALTSKFKGQALGATKTYAGQMAALGVASANVKETIGKGILDALAIFGGGGTDGIKKATDAMEEFAVVIAEAVVGFAELSKVVKDSFIGEILYKAMKGSAVALLLKALGNFGKSKGNEAAKTAAYSSTSMYFTAETAERAKLVGTIKKQNTIENEKKRLAAAELAEKKKQAELDALKKKFDIGRINLETALANSKDDAEKARIKSLLTIMDEDAGSAAKRMSELDKANTEKMKAELAAADNLRNLAAQAGKAAAGLSAVGNASGTYNYTKAAPSFVYGAGSVPDLPDGMGNGGADNTPIDYGYTAAMPSFTYGAGNPNYNITVNTPVGSEEVLTETVQRVIQKLNRMGDNLSFAGAL
jgi:hypothetical protein